MFNPIGGLSLHRVDCPRCIALVHYLGWPVFKLNGGYYIPEPESARLSDLHEIACGDSLQSLLADLVNTPMELTLFPSVDTGYSVRLHNTEQKTYSDLTDVHPAEIASIMRQEAREINLLP